MVLRHAVRFATIALGISLALGAFVMHMPTLYAQVDGSAVSKRRAQLERQLDRLEDEIAQQQQLLEEKQRERVTLERDVAILDAQIRKAQLSIEARDLVIRGLEGEIQNKEVVIGDLNEKLEREKASLAQLMRRTHEIDDFSIVEIVLGNQNLSDFFEDLDRFTALQEALQESFREIEVTKTDTQAQKQSLEGKQAEEVELRRLQVIQKQEIELREREKQRILGITKGQETAYQNVIATVQKTAAEIRSELFALRDTAAIPFEKALQYANEASRQTGVRPALILGVIAQESRLGEFIGTGNWRSDMHPTRDQPVFERLMAELGLDPDKMPVSAKPSYGWGGAMGPAQFIPSTWEIYKDRIADAVGHSPPNPYDPRTAFTASALLLADNGASRGSAAAERLAALRYFAGWKNAERPAYAFYGDGVMELADQYQQQINILASA